MARFASLLGPPLKKMCLWYFSSSNLMWLAVGYPIAFLAAYILGYFVHARSRVSDDLLISIFGHVPMLKSALMLHHANYGENEAGRIATTFLLYGLVALCGGVWAAYCGAHERSQLIKRQPDVSWASIPLFLIVVVGLILLTTTENISGECSSRACFWKRWPFELAIFAAPVFFGPYSIAVYWRFRK